MNNSCLTLSDIKHKSSGITDKQKCDYLESLTPFRFTEILPQKESRKEFQCDGKIKHNSRIAAVEFGKEFALQNGNFDSNEYGDYFSIPKQGAYSCPHCNAWHLTTHYKGFGKNDIYFKPN